MMHGTAESPRRAVAAFLWRNPMKIQTLVHRLPLSHILRGFTQKHVGEVLERFARRIASIQVELKDKNGRRGGGDKRCRIRVELVAGQAVLVEEEQASIHLAIRRAASRAAARLRVALRGE